MTFQKGHPEPISKPMRLARLGSVKSMLVNPRDGKPNGVPVPFSVESDAHQEEMNAITDARMEVLRGNWPTRYFQFCDINPMPQGFLAMAGISMDNPAAAADFVRMDSPDELFKGITVWAAAEGIPLKYEQPNCVDFLGRHVHPATYFQNLTSERMELAFEAKAFYLQDRPEELVCDNFGHYGCPAHPEAPAGHGTFAGCAYKAFADVYDPEPYQLESVRQGCLMLAHLRDIAGMHVRQSSRNGFELGACNIGPATKVRLPNYITRWA